MKWISVKERLPEYQERVLVHEEVKPEWENLSVTIGYLNTTTKGKSFETNEWYSDNNYQSIDVTHWMPLPEPPNKEIE